MTPRRVALVAPTIAEGDAVGLDVLGMADALERAGHEVHLFARVADAPRTVGAIEQAADVLTRPTDVLIYHHSIDCAAGVRLTGNTPARVVVRYHSVTPPHLLDDEPDLAHACARGLEQLVELARRADRFWATSALTRRELHEHFPGLTVEELPPFHQVSQFAALPTDATAAFVAEWRTRVLMVGRLAPNKNVPLALAAFASYRRRDRRARLVLAGPAVSERATAEAARLIRELELAGSVTITGKITPPELKALYLTSQVLLVASEHEGFGVPLVEAMALRLPVVALARAAVPDTAGPAARLVERADPDAVASALHSVVSDAALREHLIDEGWRRYQEQFTNERIAARCVEMFARAGETLGA